MSSAISYTTEHVFFATINALYDQARLSSKRERTRKSMRVATGHLIDACCALIADQKDEATLKRWLHHALRSCEADVIMAFPEQPAHALRNPSIAEVVTILDIAEAPFLRACVSRGVALDEIADNLIKRHLRAPGDKEFEDFLCGHMAPRGHLSWLPQISRHQLIDRRDFVARYLRAAVSENPHEGARALAAAAANLNGVVYAFLRLAGADVERARQMGPYYAERLGKVSNHSWLKVVQSHKSPESFIEDQDALTHANRLFTHA